MKYQVKGIPCLLKNRPVISTSFLAPEALKAIIAQHDQAIFPVSGDCLEAAQVMDGGWVAVDFIGRPAPPRHKSQGGDGSFDLCMCLTDYDHRIVMLKAYDGKWGPMHMVSTRYAPDADGDFRLNIGMQAIEIYGVIFASWDRDGKLLWQRDPREYPEVLTDRPTIHGVNVGGPIKA